MKEPKIRYLVASPIGDVAVRDSRLDYPLEADPLKTSYRLYFQAMTDFLSKDSFRPLLQACNKEIGNELKADALNEIIIRTEKHGALYHPASIECFAEERKAKFALNVAVTATGKKALKKEYDVLRSLHEQGDYPYLPRPYHMDEIHSMVLLLEEWFEDYHEFHIAKTGHGVEQMKLWEYGKGCHFLSKKQSFEIYKQIARILTLYYDVEHYRTIFPWHHAAGDFVVKIDGTSKNKIDTRLTTARGYEPFIGSDDDRLHPSMALFFFFLHLSLQMRLDRLDGVGDVVWAGDECVDATISGFFAGLESKADFRDHLGSVAEFLKLLRSFSMEELAATFGPVVEQYEKTMDFPVIERNLGDHVARLFFTLRNCR